MTTRAPLLAALATTVVAASLPARAEGVLVLRTKGAQIDEAVAALKGDLGGSIAELVVDDGTAVDAVSQRAAGAGAMLIVGVGARAAQLALKQSTLPVVHCMVLTDAAALDTDRSAGVPLAVPPKAQLAALKRIVPAVKNVGLLYDPKLNARFAADAVDAGRALGIKVTAVKVAASTGAPAALDDLLPAIDALLLSPDATVVTKELITFVVARAFEKHLPILSFSPGIVKAGALAALAPSYAQNGKLCAALARRVLAGEKPAALRGAIEMSGTLIVNVATARRIGVSLSADVQKAPTELVGQ